MADIVMKKGDRLPSVLYTCLPPEGTDISAAASAAFKFQPIAGGAVTSGACVILSASRDALALRYDWGVADTATAGDYKAEFVVTLGGKELTFPNDDPGGNSPFFSLRIWADVA